MRYYAVVLSFLFVICFVSSSFAFCVTNATQVTIEVKTQTSTFLNGIDEKLSPREYKCFSTEKGVNNIILDIYRESSNGNLIKICSDVKLTPRSYMGVTEIKGIYTCSFGEPSSVTPKK